MFSELCLEPILKCGECTQCAASWKRLFENILRRSGEHVQRIQVITIAETNLHNFPFDTRNCTLVLSNDDSRAIWSRVLSITLPQDHIHSAATSDLVVNDARMREYRHVEVSLKRCLHSWTHLAVWPHLSASLNHLFVHHLFMPSAFSSAS
uniref:Uncharacterized protein n=1 Tax=Ditylenchus dipsaci TaxID=166011 RepID=A0A915EL73_9BILA